jgi:YedE family putative selenium metabolism protein
MNPRNFIIFTGIVIGLVALSLVYYGNPANMGVCVACFIRDTSGGLGLHRVEVSQYIRPEIIGLGLGAFLMAIFTKSFKPVASSSSVLTFVLAVFVVIGALVFLGCPTRMILRLGGGDLNALVGLVGFIAGLSIGYYFKNRGFSLGQEIEPSTKEALVYPILNVFLLVLLVTAPAFIYFSATGPGSFKAPLLVSLGLTLIVGVLAYKTKFCFAGSFVGAIYKKEFAAFFGILAVFLTVVIGNVILGNFKLSFISQPIAHTDGLYNFLGMVIVGWGSSLLSGCPFRQVIKAGSGNSNAAIVILGFLVGAAFAHNFGLAASPKGVGINGQIAVFVILVFMFIISYFGRKQN